MKKLKYKETIRDQVIIATLFVGGFIGTMFVLKPYSTVDLIVLSVYGLLGLSCFSIITSKTSTAVCPHCNSELFDLITKFKSKSLEINYCPKCGNEIEI